jgi:tripartite ATP-independent transporter DctM subunit
MSYTVITIILFGSLGVVLLTGLPLAFVLGGIAVIFTAWLWGIKSLYMIPNQTFGAMTNVVLVAVPMFIFMANVLERSGIADSLYKMMYYWMGRLRGGLAMGTVLICTLFAAMTGISGAATVTMGLIALPSMLKYKYDKSLAIGSIAAGGALGILIPPSVIMILYGLMAEQSVGKLFIGGIFPGLVLSSLFILYIGTRSAFQSDIGPSVPYEERVKWKEKFIALKAVILPIILVIIVLGSIFAGLTTPTEASAIGAVGALACAAITRRLNWSVIKGATYKSFELTCMVMWIFVGATVFSTLYQALGGPQLMEQLVENLAINRWGILIIMQFTLFVLGCFMDPTGILMVTTPVFVPVVITLGFDPLWYGILFVVNMEMAFLTPPFGFNLFYMKGVAPPGITMGDIYRSVIPFVILQAVGLALLMVFPQLALWLPKILLG